MKMHLLFHTLCALALWVLPITSFSTPGTNCRISTRNVSPLYQNAQQQTSTDLPDNDDLQRRNFLIAAATMTSISLTAQPVLALGDDDDNNNLGPISIIGANGKTGSECVAECIARGINVRATSRGGVYNGVYNTEENSPFISTAPCDVTNPSTINAAIEGSRAVIFAASASKQGGTPSAVDNAGLVNVAKACIALKIPHLVVVSSGGVSKPDSPIYKFLNIFGKIMEEKIKGEDDMRALYKGIDSQVSTYTVIRPGGLTVEPGKGVAALELNQGDLKSGRISRADVAALCIEATLHPNTAGGTTFECYDADTAKTLGAVGASNAMKSKNKATDVVFMTGKERRGDNWEAIFSGLEKDF